MKEGSQVTIEKNLVRIRTLVINIATHGIRTRYNMIMNSIKTLCQGAM